VDASSFKGVSIVSDTTTRFYGVTVTSVSAGTSIVVSGTAGDNADAEATAAFGLVKVESRGSVFNGTTWDRKRGDTAGEYVQGSVSVTTAVGTRPLGIAGRAASTNPTTVADGALVSAMFTRSGKLVVTEGNPRELKTRSNITLSTTTEAVLQVSGTAGTFNDILTLVASNGSTQTVRVDFKDISGGSVVYSCWLAANGGGFVLPVGTLLPQATAASNWTATLSTGLTTNDVRIMVVTSQNK
jgi:hypothetical protein